MRKLMLACLVLVTGCASRSPWSDDATSPPIVDAGLDALPSFTVAAFPTCAPGPLDCHVYGGKLGTMLCSPQQVDGATIGSCVCVTHCVDGEKRYNQ